MIRRIERTVLAALVPLALAIASPAQDHGGWKEILAGSSVAKTESALKGDLDKNPSDAASAYGLALVQLAKGEREKAVVTALEGLRSAPGDPAAFLLEDLVGDDAAFNRATTRLVSEALPLLSANPKMDPLVRFNLRWLGCELAARKGDRKARQEAMAQAGFVPAALFSRPDKELSRTGFYEVGAPERGVFAGDGFEYSELAGLQCRPPSYRVPPSSEYNVYALLPFSVPQGAEALLYFNAAKAYKVLLDEKPLFTKDVFKRQENPTALWRVRLNPGPHRLLIKLHCGAGDEGVHVALLDADGYPLGVQWARVPAQGPAAGFQDRGEWRGAFWSAFPAGDPRYKGFSALWYRWQGDVAYARVLMEEAVEAAPNCLAWNLWVARMYLTEADDLPAKIAQSRAEKAVEAALSVDPDDPQALYFKSILQGTNSDADQDLATLSALVEKAPADPRWSIALADRFQTKGWVVQARSVLERAASYHPECEAMESAWISFYQRLPDPEGQAAAIRRLEALRSAGPEWEQYDMQTRRWDDLRRLLEEESARYGDRDRRFGSELAKLEARTGHYPESRRRFEALRELSPADPDVSLSLARVCFLMGDREAGMREWARLKSVKPDAFQVDIARWAIGEPLPFQDRHLPLEQVLKEDTAKDRDASPSSLLLDQMATRVETDGSSVERYHGILRINDKEGVDREGEQQLPGQIILSLRTVKPDGRILEPEQIPEKETISMQGLEPGDIIEYEYLTLKQPSGVRPNAYVTAQVYLFQDIEKPFHRTQWYLEWPKSIPMQLYEQNLPKAARKGTEGDREWRDWDYRDMPRIAPEPDTPNKVLYVPLVEAVGGIGWKDLGRFLKEGVTGAYQITPEMERQYRDAVGDAKTPQEKVDRIVRFVLKEVDGDRGGWQDPTQTLMTRQGSRVPVAAAFLSLSGIPFDLLVAEAVPDQVYRENLPRIGQFSAPILKVELPSGVRYLTLGSPYRDPYVLPWYLQGARAVSMRSPDPWALQTIPADFTPWSNATEEEDRELLADGDMRLQHHQLLDPEASEGLRGSLRRLDKDQWRQAIQVALSKQFGNVDLLDYSVDNADDPFKPLGWNYTLLVHGYALSEGGRLTVTDPLPSLHLGQAYASLRERRLPLTTGGPIFVSQRLKLTLPAGMKAEYAPPAMEIKNSFGSYSISGKLGEGSLSIERKIRVPYEIVWPDKYLAFAGMMRKVDEAEAGQLVLTPK